MAKTIICMVFMIFIGAMILSRRTKSALVVGTALLLITAIPTGVMAGTTADSSVKATQSSIYSVNEPASETNQSSVYEVNENGTSSFSSTGERVSDKQDYVMERRNSDGISTKAIRSDSDTMDVRGSEISLNTELDATFGSGVKATFDASGTTESAWYGSSPFNADKITQTTTVGVNGVQVSVSYPPALNSGGGYSATITQSVTNEWQMKHEYSGFHAESYVALYDGYQSDSTTFRFGTDSYTLFTHASLAF